MERRLTEPERGSGKLSRKSFEKISEKYLTNASESDIIETLTQKSKRAHQKKFFKKLFKKGLTKPGRCAIINKLSHSGAKAKRV